MRCKTCAGEFKVEDGTLDECPVCVKEKNRKDNLVCRSCGHTAQVFYAQKTCYSIKWTCPKCESNDVHDPDCVIIVDDQEYDVV